MKKKTKFLRVDDKTLEILKLKKEFYYRVYGKRIRSLDDVLKIEFGLSFIPLKRFRRTLKRFRRKYEQES
jgi:hypothetical protein